MTEESTQVIDWDINKAAIAEVAEDLKDIDAYVDFDAAKAAKKTLVKMRSTLTEAHKETKAKALAFGRDCDAKKNEYLTLIKAIEDPISADLDKIKNAAAQAEEERVSKIMAEIERIQAYSLDRHSLTLTELNERLENLRAQEANPELLEEYGDDWDLAKQEADLKLRLAIDREKSDQKEREEKAELKRKNDELQAQLDKSNAEQAERDAEAQKVADEKAKEAQAAQKIIDDEKQAEFDRVAKEQEDERKKLDKEREEREQAEQDERDRIAGEEAEVEAAKLAAMQAPDIEKLDLYAADIKTLIDSKPVMGSTAGNGALLEVVGCLIAVAQLIDNHIEEMK